MGLFSMLKRLRGNKEKRRESLLHERAVVVTDTHGMITAVYPKGERQSVAWDDVTSIEVHTNDSGPWGADVWWVLRSAHSICSYPQGATGEEEMIPKYPSLPGFDNDALIKAMRSTSNQQFICWSRERATT